MTRYQMEDGTIVNTDKASEVWDEDTTWNGNNHISKATGSQWSHERLYKSRKGRYYTECWSQWQGTTAHAEWVDNREAARWLLANDCELPEDLEHLRDEVEE